MKEKKMGWGDADWSEGVVVVVVVKKETKDRKTFGFVQVHAKKERKE